MSGSLIRCTRCHAGPGFLMPHEIPEDAVELPLLIMVTCDICKFTFVANTMQVMEMMEKLYLHETNGRIS